MNKTSSKEYSRKLRKFIEAKEDFDKQLIDEQKEQLENLLELSGDMHGQEFQEYFIAQIYSINKTNGRGIYK